MLDARRCATALLVAIALMATGCSVPPPPSGIQLVLPARPEVRALPVTVVDHADVISDAAPAEIPADAPWETTIRAVDGRDDAVLLTWMGGACDDRAIVTVDEVGARYRVTVKTEMSGMGCTAVGVFRAVLLTLAKPIEPDAFQTADDPAVR